MTTVLPPLRLVGAQVLIDGAFSDTAVTIENGVIGLDTGFDLPTVDLSGYLVLPGIVDLHGDGFEHHIVPRPTADFPIAAGLASFDREAAANGVTTAYMAQGWSWEGGHRGADKAEAMLMAVRRFSAAALTDLRVQLRVETHYTEASDRLLDCIEEFGVGLVVLNNHLDEALTMMAEQPDAFAAWARKTGQTAQAMRARVLAAQSNALQSAAMLPRWAEAFTKSGVVYGSHDDADAETRGYFSALGARIAEFPTTLVAARAAKSAGDPVLMGAPNVVRGKSQSGNIAAADLIRQGMCDGLVSDYHVPALALSAWTMVDQGMASLPTAWEMISTNPARIVGLSDRGRIAQGQRADLVIVNPDTRAIEATIANGRISYAQGKAAVRLMSARQQVELAAE